MNSQEKQQASFLFRAELRSLNRASFLSRGHKLAFSPLDSKLLSKMLFSCKTILIIKTGFDQNRLV